jgi:uncharacterized protein (DUF58 family)
VTPRGSAARARSEDRPSPGASGAEAGRGPRADHRPALAPIAGPGAGLARRALARIARWLRPPRKLRPTRAGWMFLLISFGVGFAALNTGNNLLYLVLSLMLAFLVLSGVFSESALRGITVRRRLPREIHAGMPASIGLEITNDQRRVPAFAVVVEDRFVDAGGERAAGRAFVLRAGAGETEHRAYRFSPPRRGPLVFSGFEVFTRFPFGLFSKALTLEAPERTLVYPGIEPLEAPPDLRGAEDHGAGRSGARGGGGSVSGLREYERGDPPPRIHWPASLRRGTLLVREVEAERHPEVEVRLRTRGQRAGERFEKAVRWAASEVVALLDRGARVALATDGEHIAAGDGPAQRGRLLSFLARVEPGSGEAEA